jgi:hypothetical protein
MDGLNKASGILKRSSPKSVLYPLGNSYGILGSTLISLNFKIKLKFLYFLFYKNHYYLSL